MNEPLAQTTDNSTSVEIVAPDSTAAILQEVLDESTTVDREAAKAVIRKRMQEIKKAELLVEKMKADLNNLLKKTPAEIAAYG